MKQTRKASLIESITNIAVGVTIAFFTNIVIFWLISKPLAVHENVILTACFTGVSLVRSYTLRRLFEVLRVRGLLPILIGMAGIQAAVAGGEVLPVPGRGIPVYENNEQASPLCKPDECFDEHRGCSLCR